METNKVSYWMGTPITELSKEDLLEVVEYCGKEILRLRQDRDRWRESGDAAKYLMNVPNVQGQRGA